jgi:hypothetical protein
VFSNKTLILSFTEPLLPFALQRVVVKNQRLLRRSEKGIPSWAVFLPCYGCPYRPWFRMVYEIIYVLTSFIAVICGFYDLYKNIPGIRKMLHSFSEPFFDWLEEHAHMRLSILATYFISKFAVLEVLITHLHGAWRSVRSVLAVLLKPFALMTRGTGELVGAIFAGAGGAVMEAFKAVQSVVGPVIIEPLLGGGASLLRLICYLGTALLDVTNTVFIAPLTIGLQVVHQCARSVGDVAAYPLVLIRGAAQSKPMAEEMGKSSWMIFSRISWDPLQFISRLWKDFKSILNFIIHVCCTINQHRLRCVRILGFGFFHLACPPGCPSDP